ncbi:MAG: 30S ribosomal protein S15 [Saprospiraceae bacterium]|jgi:small subunit ribosomal protein S15|nr:30S ribosomal protein S15 [Saprospiraceae bacterium]MBK6477821.1 30S ribosomal protein S15 [Saprospiraceae bacterium]MBK6816303.1 30S ribosomal protein S15 [Saprospiraceae bacterium]MBK7370419.1 30S ribosomal protein S15 [Saprospiraceae bacterium]MBK7438125.1 30S ribosomal protein S15 [Saprospiraceae bacterium]
MPAYMTKEKVQDLMTQYGGRPENTGSVEAQIALFTFRINQLQEHLNHNRKDHSCRRSLLTIVGQRKQLLNYLAKHNLNKYRELLEQLGIRK